jgi:pSer/pThr/pTyr-binding forkhead associated (FHA) protein
MFTLTIEDSNGQIADRFSFDHGAYVIGRQDSCDIVLPSPSVSRQHARIFIDNGRCYVEDLGSANGVVVDGQRVIQQRDLGTASQIKVGDYYLYLEYKRPERSAQANVLQTLFISDDADHYKLVRINDSFAGEEFGLSEVENTIGRTDDNFILLSDTSISRQHARIVRDGEIYTLMDLGSSNGSRVNGKEVSTPTTLTAGDRVQFGNIEFVFVEGNANVNPADYARATGGNVIIYAGLAAFLLLGLAGGALIVFGWLTLRDDASAQPAQVVSNDIDTQAATLLEEGKERMARKDWEGAVSTFDELLALKPDAEKAKKLRERAQIEAEAKSKYERGEILVEGGRHRDAREVLAEISEDTAVYDKAQNTLMQINKTLAHNLRNEAARLSKSKSKSDLLDAHEKLKESMSLVPDDDETRALLDDLEKKLKRRKIKFESFKG